ncbi:SRPBCC family protein [Rhizobium sp. FKY42]|uniref:SRPBCC family protein n=1 Tax=Rhizobium sp. FKY42 TaxID=2562310 RepID=UPI0010C02811|nr:SRPBCC family protein [Rhizobium sp. FKY42]
MPVLETKVVNASIQRDWRQVYAFASQPEKMAQWASGLGNGLEDAGDHWLVDGGPLGKVKVRFSPQNDHGIVDHWVEMPSGMTVYNAFRIVKNGDGAEALFLVTRLPGMSEEQFEQDARHVATDLDNLKRIMESEISV